MKKLILSFALLINTIFLLAADNKANVVKARYVNVKMYRQPGTSSEILTWLKGAEEVVLIRQHNKLWSIVTVNEKVGYVLTSELNKPEKSKWLQTQKK